MIKARYSKESLEERPTLAVGQDSDLKIDDETRKSIEEIPAKAH